MEENHSNEASQFAETPIEVIHAATARVEKILNENFSEHLTFGDGSFTLKRGSTQVMIIVRPFADDETCIECISNVVTGAKITPDLMYFLLRKNAELHYGAFGLLFDDTITFSHSIFGKNLDANELINTVNSVAVIADYYDDIIVDLAGGKRAQDLLEDFE
jgi:adenylate cyclase